MKSHIVRDGNAFYEIDEECLRRRQREKAEERRNEDKGRPQKKQGGEKGRTG